MVQMLEIFNSISGEVSPKKQGCLTTFLRLAGCNLNCSYCDTPTAHDIGYKISLESLIENINPLIKQTGNLCITGGEPLLQKNIFPELIKQYKNCWVETNGTIDFSELIGSIGIVTDYKLEEMNEIPRYFYNLDSTDFVKFVISSRSSLSEAIDIQRRLQIGGCQATFAYSPVYQKYSIKDMLDFLFNYSMPKTIINTQIHKYLGLK